LNTSGLNRGERTGEVVRAAWLAKQALGLCSTARGHPVLQNSLHVVDVEATACGFIDCPEGGLSFDAANTVHAGVDDVSSSLQIFGSLCALRFCAGAAESWYLLFIRRRGCEAFEAFGSLSAGETGL
jgi:hypothetical protein